VVVWFYGCPDQWYIGMLAGLEDFQMDGWFSGIPFICLNGKPGIQPYYFH
jgi:hypothetical protein